MLSIRALHFAPKGVRARTVRYGGGGQGTTQGREAIETPLLMPQIEARYSKMTIAQLKDLLELNKQLKGGTKSV